MKNKEDGKGERGCKMKNGEENENENVEENVRKNVSFILKLSSVILSLGENTSKLFSFLACE